jgi:DNA invertase Pin-like site-specific DNA recombinase
MSRVAIYARVSLDDGRQDAENQLRELREWCAHSGHTVAQEYVERVSGGKGADERPELARLLLDAHKRRFDVVLCWALDRLSREGMASVIDYLGRLDRAGVQFRSYTEPALSTDNAFVRDVMVTLAASMAKMERAKISERTRAGLARVMAKGVKVGRRPLDPERQVQIAELAAEGLGPYAIAKRLGLDIKTAQKYLA